jgi:uncharacterized protein YjdB
MKKLIILLTIAALVCVTFTAMAAGDGIAFDASEAAISEGETLQTVLAREGAAEGGELTYTSSDQKVATVDGNGLVTAVKKGRAVITATVRADNKSYKAQIKVTVVKPVTSVTVNTDKLPVYAPTDEKIAPYLSVRENAEENELPVLLLPVKKKYQLLAAVEPKDASNRNVTFIGSDDSVFTVAKNAVTGVAPGEAILTVASESNPEVNTRFRVLVVQPVTKVTIEMSQPAVTVGGQMTVTAKVEPENATIKSVEWSGDGKFVTVDGNGTVTGLKHGNGRVIATSADGSNVRANSSVKVVQNPESIALGSEEITVAVGRTGNLKATVLPKDADNKKVIWTSSDESIATVNKTGQIKGIAIGDCTVTCTSEALDSVSATATVHIVQPVTRISFNSKTALVYVNETTQLEWTVEPDNATNKTLEFKSAKTAIATVDAEGIVYGVKAGKTTVNATSTDGSKRKGTINIHVGKHVESVRMYRRHAYIDPGQSAKTKAIIEPKDALNKNISWETSDPGIVIVAPEKDMHVSLTGVNYGDAVVTATTEDGGFQATIPVTVGDFDNGVAFLGDIGWDEDAQFSMVVRNDTNFVITQITAVVSVFNGGEAGNPPLNTNKSGKNTFNITWSGRLNPGQKTGRSGWRTDHIQHDDADTVDFNGSVTVTGYQIDGDWVHVIQPKHRTTRKYGHH